MQLLLALLPAFSISISAWPCVDVIRWLWHRRRAPVKVRYRGARRVVVDPVPARKAHWRKKPEWVRQAVMDLAVHGKSCRWIRDAFNREHGPAMTIGHSWAAEIVKAHAAQIAERKRTMRCRRPLPFAVGHTWGLDLTFLRSGQGATFTMLGILDHGSRKLLCLKQLPRKCALTILGHVLLTMARHGMPAVIRTDNESMFTGVVWRSVLTALKVSHRRSKPAHPWQNGRIERLFGTLKPPLRSVKPNTSKALHQTLCEFTWFYNHVRVHQNLMSLTPEEAWQGKTLADVQQAHARDGGCWVQALDGRTVGKGIRC